MRVLVDLGGSVGLTPFFEFLGRNCYDNEKVIIFTMCFSREFGINMLVSIWSLADIDDKFLFSI